ncbi:MAG: hypothetical protein A2Y25_07990 [Candidatus Melainabacteria bacterium GWF2_37_15]|nr:MAG: hypothetical protein A2Y25_07990 [Candidatus Melainabacteria bacterium GWF2_37_15]
MLKKSIFLTLITFLILFILKTTIRLTNIDLLMITFPFTGAAAFISAIIYQNFSKKPIPLIICFKASLLFTIVNLLLDVKRAFYVVEHLYVHYDKVFTTDLIGKQLLILPTSAVVTLFLTTGAFACAGILKGKLNN